MNDGQVDWVTLQEHKVSHEADYVVLVAPGPTGTRLFERAATQQVTVIAVDELAHFCEQHTAAPLELDQYRRLFTSGGRVDPQGIAEEAENWVRLAGLAAAACDAIRKEAPQFGPLTARDLRLVLARQPTGDDVTEVELADLLTALASPLVGILDGNQTAGYRVTVSPSVAHLRLENLASRLGRRDVDITDES